MIGRPIMWRQTAFCFYRPGALAIANSISDIPFSAAKIFVFSFIVSLLSRSHVFASGQQEVNE
jgi:hypothetical protein